MAAFKRKDPGRLEKIVRGLSTLPPEVIHPIIDELPLPKLLDLAACHHHEHPIHYSLGRRRLVDGAHAHSTYFARCIITHRSLQETFPTLASLDTIIWMRSVCQALSLLMGPDYNRRWAIFGRWVPEVFGGSNYVATSSGYWRRFSERLPRTYDQVAEALSKSVLYMLNSCKNEIETLTQYPYTEEYLLLCTYYKWSDILNGKLEGPWVDLIDAARTFNALRST